MANPEHLRILQQGVHAWNSWRITEPGVRPDLTRADLRRAGLNGADFRSADMREVTLFQAGLNSANFTAADLQGATLNRSFLTGTSFVQANLAGAGLFRTSLQEAVFVSTVLEGAFIGEARFRMTVLADVDLSTVQGLESIRHQGPSTIGIDTIYRSKGHIPEIFLRGCGVDGELIAVAKNVWRTPARYYSCFISHSSQDDLFTGKLYNDLLARGVRCFYAPEHMKIGDRIRDRLDREIREHDKLLLVLSQHSIDSDWVEDEVEAAYENERQQHRTVLFPIRLDQTVMDTEQAWAAKLRRDRYIGDFRDWCRQDTYQTALARLLHDLEQDTTTGV